MIPRANTADKEKAQELPRAPMFFEVGAKHPQAEHVEQNCASDCRCRAGDYM
jgi:hypothetical protein